MERFYSLVYVPAGRNLLCGGGQSQKTVAQAAAAHPPDGGGAADHGVGAAVRLAGKPKFQGVGLPAFALKFPGADLSAVHTALDSGELGGDAALYSGGPGD